MKNYRQIFLIVSALFLANSLQALASSSTVNVQSITNSSSTSTSVVNSNTHIRIETNGVVKECDSNNGDCSHMESDDGSSKVQVNNNSAGTTVESTDNGEQVTPTTTASNSAKTIISEQKKIIKEHEQSLLEEIKDFFKSIFEAFKFKI